MKRQVSLEEISDGKLYGRGDLVKAGCGGCRGCSECCRGMGNSVVLDPFDMFRLTTGLQRPFESLMADAIELNVVDGIILPNLKMSADGEACAFLNAEGRCSIHAFRPGICRLFPLGRYYEMWRAEGRGEDAAQESKLVCEDTQGRAAACGGLRTFRYFLQVHECPAPHKTKVKVEKWIDTANVPRYEKFVNDWHYFLEDVQERLEGEDETTVKNANLFLLKLFYIRPYDGAADFYGQFESRLAQAKDVLEIAGAV